MSSDLGTATLPYAELKRLREQAASALRLGEKVLLLEAELARYKAIEKQLDEAAAEAAKAKPAKKKRPRNRAEGAWMPEILAHNDVFRAAWKTYLGYRRMAHPTWSTGKDWAEHNLKRLAEWAEEHGVQYAIEALENSMDWQGIFPPKAQAQRQDRQAPAPGYHRSIDRGEP